MKHDYGFYGSGMSGYVHYRQAMDESKRSRYPGKEPLSPAEPPSWGKVISYGIAMIALWGGLFLSIYLSHIS